MLFLSGQILKTKKVNCLKRLFTDHYFFSLRNNKKYYYFFTDPIKAKITERDDKSYATQVYYSMALGATRMEEAKVFQVPCDE